MWLLQFISLHEIIVHVHARGFTGVSISTEVHEPKFRKLVQLKGRNIEVRSDSGQKDFTFLTLWNPISLAYSLKH